MVLRAIALYLVAIVSANLLMTYVIGNLAFTWFLATDFLVCFLLIAIDLVVRDALHERWEGQGLWLRMLVLIGAGSVLSYLVNGAAGRVALASFLAFFAAGITDTLVYQAMRFLPRLQRITASNLASACADSIVWPLVALGAVSPLVTTVEFTAKVLGGVVWAAILVRTIWQQVTEAP